MAWTEEQRKALEEYHAARNSMSKIAQLLNARFGTTFSRNAVIGQVSRSAKVRNKEKPKAAVSSPAQAIPPLDLPPIGLAPGASLRIEKRRLGSQGPVVTSQEAAVSAATRDLDEKARAHGLIDLMELTERTCRWPVGDPGEESFGFCGQPSGSKSNGQKSSYCEEHQNLSVRPLITRPRERRA